MGEVLISPQETLDKAVIQVYTVQWAFPEFVALQNPIISQCGVYMGLYHLYY